MQELDRKQEFFHLILNQLEVYDMTLEESTRAARQYVFSGMENRTDKIPLTFQSLVIHQVDNGQHLKYESCKITVHIFRLETFCILNVILSDEKILHKELMTDAVENYAWCLPKEIAWDDVALISIGQAGTFLVKRCIREEKIDLIQKAFVKLVMDHPSRFAAMRHDLKIRIYGHLFDMLDSNAKHECLKNLIK